MDTVFNEAQVEAFGSLKGYITAEKQKRELLDTLADCAGARDKELVENRARNIIRSILQYVQEDITKQKKMEKQIIFCTPNSIFNCMLEAIRNDLIIDSRQLAYLVRYGKQASLSPSYMGYIFKVRKNHPDLVVRTELVFPDDVFEMIKEGHSATYHHKPANPFATDYGNIVGCYTYYSFGKGEDMQSDIGRLGVDDIKKIRGKAKIADVWNEWTDQQIKKSCVRRTFKIPFRSEISDLDMLDNQHYDMEQESNSTDIVPAAAQAFADRQRKAQEAQERKDPVPHLTFNTEGRMDILNEQLQQAERKRQEEREAVLVGGEGGGEGEALQESLEVHAEPIGREDAGSVDAEEGEGSEVVDVSPLDSLPADIQDLEDRADAVHEAEGHNGSLDGTQGADKEDILCDEQQAGGGGDNSRVPGKQPGDSGEGVSPKWDGRTLYTANGKRVEGDYPTSIAALRYLQRIMQSIEERAARKLLIEKNLPLINQIVLDGHGRLVQELHALADKGK